jgi:hypothetical protein
MPLCQPSRKGADGGKNNGRMYDCVEERQCTEDSEFCCGDMHEKGTNVPPTKYIKLNHG